MRRSLQEASLLMLQDLLDKDLREKVVQQALDARIGAENNVFRELNTVIDVFVKVNGFRSALSAPAAMLAREVVKVTHRIPTLLWCVLDAWMESQTELAITALQYLGNDLGSYLEEHSTGEQGTDAESLLEELVGPAAERLAKEQHCPGVEARVMVYTALHRILVTGESTKAPEDETACGDGGSTVSADEQPFHWETVLEELRNLPADDVQWDCCNDFIEGLKQLLEQKMSERSNGRQLREAFSRLIEECGDEVQFFQIEIAEKWLKESVNPPCVPGLTENVDALREALVRYRELRLSPVKTLTEERQRREQLGTLENQVKMLFNSLDAALCGVQTPGQVPLETAGAKDTREEGSEKGVQASACGEVKDCAEDSQDNAVEDNYETIEPDPATASGERVPEESARESIEAGNNVLDQHMVHPEGKKEVQGSSDNSQPGIGQLRHTVPKTELEGFFWRMLSEDDLAGAYWMSCSLVAAGGGSPVHSWLLQAVQGARWLNMDDPCFVEDLSRIARRCQPSENAIEELLGLAASLRSAIIAPGSGLMGWLKTPHQYPGFNALVQTIKEFAHLGKPLLRVDLLGVAGAQEFDQEIKNLANGAQRWLDEAGQKRTKLARATAVWLDLVSMNGRLRAVLSPVAADCRERWEDVRCQINQWLDRSYIEQCVSDIDRRIIGRRIKPITGEVREQIIRFVRDACNLALRWCGMVERDVDNRTKGRDWMEGRIANLRSGIQKLLPEVQMVIGEMKRDAGSEAHTAVAACLERSLQQLCNDLGINLENSSLSGNWDWLSSEADDIESGMAKRLILVPEVDLDDSGLPNKDSLPRIANALYDAGVGKQELRECFDRRLAKRDYRFIDSLLLAVSDEAERAELSRRVEEELAGARAALDDVLTRTRDEVEQAVVDGILSAEERASHLDVILNIDTRTTLNFPVCEERSERIRASILEARQNRLNELGEQWEVLQRRLTDYPGEKKEKEEALKTVHHALQREDTRVVEECIAELTRLMDAGEPLKENSLILRSEKNDAFRKFMDVTPRITELLSKHGPQALQDAAGRGRQWGGLNFTNFPRGLQDETVGAVAAWRRLKQGTARNPNNQTHIEKILRFLGFNVDSLAKTAVTILKKNDHWVHAHAIMSAGGRSPIPQFGSQQQGCYDVVCLWERPSVDTFAGWLRDLRLENRNILVLYLGRMSMRHRRVMRQITSDRELAIIVLDEILFAFLTGERVERLPLFFRCALPFTAANPYTPFKAGDVPPEMFFGRARMAKELQRAEGSCIVYGGRQLGKSALLRHVQREFHDPEREQYARVEDIKLVGSPTSDQRAEMVWIKLREIFKSFGLISSGVTTDRPDEVARHIEEGMQKRPHSRVLILFDEADNFLDADAEADFKAVDGLRILMAKLQRRFKVILAGLHSVQRFQGRGNQPLAHFGTPLCVGPLEADAAQRLIREPLAALGYRFADDAVLLSILSYTNYHPGLIQLFCQELLRRMNARPAGEPPHLISREDVEAIYRTAEVRTRISERFDWTLALDYRYQAVAWAMILDQTGRSDGFGQAYPSWELLQMAREWWPQGFEDTDTDQLRSLLEEMCGLGVLVCDALGHYRLRSPNLVRLMEDVESRMLELSYKEPEVKGFDPENYHAPLEHYFSPLTYAQESLLNQQRFGVGLVFASEALGLSHLTETKVDPRVVLAKVEDGGHMEKLLEKYLVEHAKHERIGLYYMVPENSVGQAELVRSALAFTQRYRKRRHQWMRVIFVFGAQATWNWLSLPENERMVLEDQADLATYLRRWNPRAIRQRLAQQDKIHSDDIYKEILRVTGGWPFLLDELFKRCGLQDDPRPFAFEMEQELGDPETQLFRDFRDALGVQDMGVVRRLIEFIHQEKDGVPVELTAPEHLSVLQQGEAALSPGECAIGIQYLRWMGLTEVRDGALWAEPIAGRVLLMP